MRVRVRALMGGDDRVKLLCSFGGEFVREQGKPFYLGGKTRLVSIDRSSSFLSLLVRMAEVCNADPTSIDIKFQLPDGSLDSRLISVETDDDVRNMIEEFGPDRKIPVFLSIGDVRNGVDDDDNDGEVANEDGNGNPTMLDSSSDFERVQMIPATMLFSSRSEPVTEPFDSLSEPSTPATSSNRGYARDIVVGPREIFQKDSQSLVVGQEYEDVQTFRNALTSAAIAANFGLHMIRSDQRRVTARCASEGCTWRVHASRISHVRTFRIRTLTPEHTCERSGDAGHRQATAKWVANCIKDKLRNNRSYKPKEILTDIHREYGVLITYKRAFLGREKALEELRAEPSADTMPIENSDELMCENIMDGWGETDDPPRKRRVWLNKPSTPKEVRMLHCTQCNQIGHNRRTCSVIELLRDEQS